MANHCYYLVYYIVEQLTFEGILLVLPIYWKKNRRSEERRYMI